jgi:hypothetical protein
MFPPSQASESLQIVSIYDREEKTDYIFAAVDNYLPGTVEGCNDADVAVNGVNDANGPTCVNSGWWGVSDVL